MKYRHLDVSLSTDSGDWTAWSEWGPCSGDCEQDGVRNYRYKARDCISSSYHVAHCTGSRKSGEICNTDSCPGKYDLYLFTVIYRMNKNSNNCQ